MTDTFCTIGRWTHGTMTKQRYYIPTFTKISRINLIGMKYSMVVFHILSIRNQM